MLNVRIQKVLNYLKNPLNEISTLVKSGETVEIISKSFTNIEFVVDSLFNNYPTRRSYLAKDSEKLILIELVEIPNDVSQLDTQLLIEVFKATNLEFKSIESLNNYLIEESKKIVIYSSKIDDEFSKRILLAYKFILGDQIDYIFGATKESNLAIKKVYLNFSDEAILEMLKIESERLNLGFSESDVLRKINGDLDLIPNYLLQNQQVPLISEDPDVLQKGSDLNIESIETPKLVFPNEPEPSSNIDETISEVLQDYGMIEEVIDEEPEPKKKSVSPQVKTTHPKSENNEVPSGISLTEREARVYYLLKEKKFISRDELVENVWGIEQVGKTHDDAIDQFISRLRRKFVKAGYDKAYIYSKKGEGVGIEE